MRSFLVVDDSDIIRRVARAILERLAMEVAEAASGEAALLACQQQMPDAILIDWHMPQGPAGLDLINSVRLLPGGERPVILYVTTENDSVDIARALSAGADDYIVKPFNREAIEQKLIATGLMPISVPASQRA
jgi:two-component system, chemotaxis family, chemotaxis protein CheY